MTEKNEIYLPSWMRDERKRLGLLILDVAEACGVSRKTVERWEKIAPAPGDKLAILVGIGFDPVYLLTGQHTPAPEFQSEPTPAVVEESPEYPSQPGAVKQTGYNDPYADLKVLIDIIGHISNKRMGKLIDYAKNLAAEEIVQQANDQQRRKMIDSKKKTG